MARKPISKKLRFEILQRDGFTCQYCGAAAPDVVLHIDHIHAVSAGGSDDESNLTTACRDCNLGKGVLEVERHDDVIEYAVDLLFDAFADIHRMNIPRSELREIGADGLSLFRVADTIHTIAAYEDAWMGWCVYGGYRDDPLLSRGAR